MAGEQAAGPTMTDEMLVQSTLSGEKAAFRELFDRYRAGAYRVAYRFVGNHEDAMDVAQEAFVKVHRSLASFEQRSQFRTWLMRIVTNTALDLRRSRGSSPTAPLSDEIVETLGEESQPERRVETPVERMEYGELREALKRALERLSVAHRRVFVLHAEGELTYREIAEIEKISEGTVMSRLYHARKNLQKILSNAGVL